jgi:predicted RNase H-like HicB family nuclease
MVEKYTVVIWWSEEYHHFLASVPDLPGCLADGATQAEALAAIQTIALEWIEFATELGRPIPCPTPHIAPELAEAA